MFDVTFSLDLFSNIALLLIAGWGVLKFFLHSMPFAHKHPEWYLDHDSMKFNEFNGTIFLIRAGYVVIIGALLTPFFLKENLRDYKAVTLTYITLVFVLIAFLIVQTPFYINARSAEDRGIINFKPISWSSVSNFGGIMLSYYVQVYMFSLFDEIVAPNTRRLKKVAKISLFVEYVTLLSIAVCGYLSLGEKYTPDMFFLRQPCPGLENIPEIIFRVVLFLFLVTLILGIAMFNPTLRKQLLQLFKLENPTQK